MLTLQLRQAEVALGDGRLEEAARLLAPEEVRRHRQGQALLTRLVDALIQRGREHLQSERLADALADADHAGRLGGNLQDARQLRQEIAQAMVDRQEQARRKTQLVEDARRQVDEGLLSAGEAMLAEADPQSLRVAAVDREIRRRRALCESVESLLRAAMDRDDLTSAIDHLDRACRQGLIDEQLEALSDQLATRVAERTRKALADGRLDLAELLLERLGPMDRSPRLKELRRVTDQCRQARSLIEAGRVREAAESLQRLSRMLDDARWIDQAVRQCTTAADALEQLRVGPLGLVWQGSETPQDEPVRPAAIQPATAGPHRGLPETPASATTETPPLPPRFFLRADAVGSFLVVRPSKVTIGPISSPQRPDVGLLADPTAPVITIERVEDDYFLRAPQGVTVNESPCTQRLLCDGDRIALTARCRLRFRRPSAASTSAVLTLSRARLCQSDARAVILLDREMVLSPAGGGHVRAGDLGESVVLHLRQGRLRIRTRLSVHAGGRPLGADDPLPMDAPVQIGAMRIVLTSV